MAKEIICEINSRDSFFNVLKNNPGLVIVKFGAKWCKPCKTISYQVEQFFATSPPEVICCDIDIDVSTDLYSFLKSKKMVNGVPTLLCYKKGNQTFISDDSVSGANATELHQFFTRCNTHLLDGISQYQTVRVRK